jgi:hypothetical protein
MLARVTSVFEYYQRSGPWACSCPGALNFVDFSAGDVQRAEKRARAVTDLSLDGVLPLIKGHETPFGH